MTQNANNPSNTSSGQQSHGDSTTTPPANVAPSASHGDQSPTTEELERKLAEIMKENAEYRKKAREREAAAAAAEEQRKKEQGEFKQLAEQHEARVKELEPIAESYTRLASTMNAQIEAEIKDWPPEVKSLVPGADVPVESRLEHMTRLRPLLEKLQVQARGTQPGMGPNPRPAQQTAEGMGKEYDQRLRASGKYGA